MLDEYERLSSCPASKIGVYCGYIHKYADWQFAANAQLRLRRSAWNHPRAATQSYRSTPIPRTRGTGNALALVDPCVAAPSEEGVLWQCRIVNRSADIASNQTNRLINSFRHRTICKILFHRFWIINETIYCFKIFTIWDELLIFIIVIIIIWWIVRNEILSSPVIDCDINPLHTIRPSCTMVLRQHYFQRNLYNQIYEWPKLRLQQYVQQRCFSSLQVQ